MLLRQRARGLVEHRRCASAAARSGTWTISGLKLGPALGLVDAGDGFGVGGVGGEAVDGLGRNRDRLAGEDQARGLGDRIVAEGQDSCSSC